MWKRLLVFLAVFTSLSLKKIILKRLDPWLITGGWTRSPQIRSDSGSNHGHTRIVSLAVKHSTDWDTGALVFFYIQFYTPYHPRPHLKWKYQKQGDLDDVREITAAWTYFRSNQVEQLFKILKRICKGI